MVRHSLPATATPGSAGWASSGCGRAGGLLKHAHTIVAFAAPTTNSYRCLVPPFDAPVNLAVSARTARRHPQSDVLEGSESEAARVALPQSRPQRLSCVFGNAVAMIDGIENKVDPVRRPLDRGMCEMTRDEMKEMAIRTTLGLLEEAINALEVDRAVLLRGDVFTSDLITTWIAWKRTKDSTRSGCGRTRTSARSITTTDRRSTMTGCGATRVSLAARA